MNDECFKVFIKYDNKELHRFLTELIHTFSEQEVEPTPYARGYNKGLLFGLEVARDHIDLED